MKALIKAHSREGLWMLEAPEPKIGPHDVLVKISKTGICGTDLHIWDWDEWAQKNVPVPLITGHEFSGTIVKLGANVSNLTIGQRVTGEGHLIGTSSRASRAGKFHLDPETKGIGVNKPGAFAQFLQLPAFNIIPLPDFIDDSMGAILDPLGNAVHTALSFDLVGEDVLITGAGPIGVMAAAVAKHIGARRVVITDINQKRLELAKTVAGVTCINVARDDLKETMQTLDIVEGFDVGLEMSGSQVALNQMIDTLVMGGRVAMLGIPPGKSQIDWSKIVLKSITIKGVYGREIFETWYKMFAMLENGLDVSAIITHHFDAAQYRDGFRIMKSGNSGKVILDWI